MDAWAVVVGSAITGIVGLVGGITSPLTEVWRTRFNRRSKATDSRAAAFSDMLRVYAGAKDFLPASFGDEIGIRVAVAAATCVPFTSPGSEARRLTVAIAKGETVDFDALVDAITAETS